MLVKPMHSMDPDQDYANVRVYTRHLQPPSAIHQACIVDWTRRPKDVAEDPQEPNVDIVFGKGTFLSLHKFVAEEADDTGRPSGSLQLVHEQAVFGKIKDLRTLYCTFEPEDIEESTDDAMDVDQDPDIISSKHSWDRPRLGYLPKSASPTVLVATSDSGVLSFVTFQFDDKSYSRGNFYILKEVEIAEPGSGYTEAGAKIAIDPTSRVMAISALQNHIKLVILRGTKRSQFDPVERISAIDLNGTIVGMEFLTADPYDAEDHAILAVAFFNKETDRYHIATFHIGLHNHLAGPLSIKIGTSPIRLDPMQSVLHIKALPNLPCSLVYIDEEKITLVTVERGASPTNSLKHKHHDSLKLMKRDLTSKGEEGAGNPYPLISACATPPRSQIPLSDQTLYLGSDTAELYRINIQHLTYGMNFELITGDRPVGEVLFVLARAQLKTEPIMGDTNQDIILNTDYLLYSNDQGDGGILAVKEEEDGIDLFAITELQNTSPVLDFCAREPSFPGRDALFVCSGMKEEGSIKRIRSGITVESTGSSGDNFFAGATGLWSVKESATDEFDTFIVTSFIQQTKIMRSGLGGSLEDVSESVGFDLTLDTLEAGRLKDQILFQVHRGGVIAVQPGTDLKCSWQSNDSVVASACWVNEGILMIGQISAGSSSLVLLKLASSVEEGSNSVLELKVIATRSLSAEPTTIHCWQVETAGQSSSPSPRPSLQYCCVGSLEPSILVFQITKDQIRDVYTESLAQAGLESVTIPHSICVLTDNDNKRKVAVGLRDGSIISYDWNGPADSSTAPSRVLSNPRLFKLGILPVRFAMANQGRCSRVLIYSDRLWQAELKDTFEIQSVLFDDEISQASAFQTSVQEQSSHPCFVCIVDHDMQLITLQGSSPYNYQTLSLGQTPRRILDITSKKLLLVATVGDGFPFAETTLQLVDPERASNEPGLEKQHVVCETSLKQGEAVFSMAEWKIPRPNKSDAVYICIGTGLFSPTGTEISAAAPKHGRLVIFSVKQSKKGDRKFRKVEMELRWAMSMPAPVFAISTFIDMKILISNGSTLKLMGLDLENKTLVEKAIYRERWPIVQISSSGSMICTGSRREAICFYEYQAATAGERSADRIRFIKSARSMRIVSDCLALSPEFAVGVDLSGGIFGIGYSPEDPNCQHTLVDRFSIHVGEVMNRIRLTKLWPAEERSMKGVALSQHQTAVGEESSISQTGFSSAITATSQTGHASIESTQLSLDRWVLLPWTLPEESFASSQALTQASSSSLHLRTAPQALIGGSLIGSLVGFWRLRSSLYPILHALQTVMQTTYEGRPLLGNQHDRYRSLSSPMICTVDGNLLQQFMRLDHGQQIGLVTKAVGLERLVEGWLHQQQETMGMSAAEREILTSTNCLDRERESATCLEHGPSSPDKGKCATVHMIGHVLAYLQSLDWHQ
ncbi:hypothetical protein EMPS_03281 [Entomortierella parvispora]|uniref:Cleavage/polyadenylation specificity factor A subunit N-terminal domain-containing protein n=1 Tax=Entomortierella parvispora TaxID=205924 RepID=A0A9P3LU95_9FUNG|nr:hypothetical protein EMPS_03281 [Entomortierella parvispora]